MRLKNFGTLEHNLQELAAVSALTDVPPLGRSRIQTAAALYDLHGEKFLKSSGFFG